MKQRKKPNDREEEQQMEGDASCKTSTPDREKREEERSVKDNGEH
jgi:hypothetical protein